MFSVVDGARALVDLCIAGTIFAALVCVLPLLTFASAAVQRFMLPDAKAIGGAGSDAADSHAKNSSNSIRTGEFVSFQIKGMLLYMVTVQLNAAAGAAAAAWVCAAILERAARLRDASLLVLLEPAPQALDYVFLVIVAPLICATAGGVHGLAAAWHSYLCTIFLWRSSASLGAAVLAMLTSYFLCWALSVHSWRMWVASSGLFREPATETADAVWSPLASTGILLLTPHGSGRNSLAATGLAFSPTFRQLCLQLAPVGARLTLDAAAAVAARLGPLRTSSWAIARSLTSSAWTLGGTLVTASSTLLGWSLRLLGMASSVLLDLVRSAVESWRARAAAATPADGASGAEART